MRQVRPGCAAIGLRAHHRRAHPKHDATTKRPRKHPSFFIELPLRNLTMASTPALAGRCAIRSPQTLGRMRDPKPFRTKARPTRLRRRGSQMTHDTDITFSQSARHTACCYRRHLRIPHRGRGLGDRASARVAMGNVRHHRVGLQPQRRQTERTSVGARSRLADRSRTDRAARGMATPQCRLRDADRRRRRRYDRHRLVRPIRRMDAPVLP